MSKSVSSAWGELETKYFFELTPDRILTAVEASGLRCTGRVSALNSMENRVYDIEIETAEEPRRGRAWEKFRIAKFYRPGRWSAEQIREEHTFLTELQELDIPVVPPIVFDDGETLRRMPDVDIWYALFPKVGGRSPFADELTDEQLLRVGRLLGRMHNVGAVRAAPARVKLSPESYGIENLRYLIDSKTLPDEIEAAYKSIVEQICALCAPLFSRVPHHRIHGDAHLGNLLWGDDGPFWVDFDDMVTGPAVQDLWLISAGRDAPAKRQLELVVSGYEQMRSFDRSALALIEPLRALRFIHFSAWIARRWTDPAFPRTFPNFGTPRYWQEQLVDLREQLALIQEGGL